MDELLDLDHLDAMDDDDIYPPANKLILNEKEITKIGHVAKICSIN